MKKKLLLFALPVLVILLLVSLSSGGSTKVEPLMNGFKFGQNISEANQRLEKIKDSSGYGLLGHYIYDSYLLENNGKVVGIHYIFGRRRFSVYESWDYAEGIFKDDYKDLVTKITKELGEPASGGITAKETTWKVDGVRVNLKNDINPHFTDTKAQAELVLRITKY